MDNKLTLPSVLEEAKAMGYSEDDTLFDVLFANKEAKALIQTMPSQKALIIPMLKVMREKFKAVMEKNLQAMAFSFKNIFGKNIVNLA